eukprot:scaffold19230_cov129-Isochrysis_galbana.AAC.1
MAFRNRSVAPFTVTVSADAKRPRPWKTCAPAAAVASCESAGAMAARSRRIRSMTAGKSMLTCAAPPPGSRTPNSPARRASRSARAQRSSALEGTQPTLRQSPPARWSEMKATLAPRRADCLALTSPPAPAPMTTKSYSGSGAGSCHPMGRTRSSSRWLCSSSGQTSRRRATTSRGSSPTDAVLGSQLRFCPVSCAMVTSGTGMDGGGAAGCSGSNFGTRRGAPHATQPRGPLCQRPPPHGSRLSPCSHAPIPHFRGPPNPSPSLLTFTRLTRNDTTI